MAQSQTTKTINDELQEIRFIIPGEPFGKERPKVTFRSIVDESGNEKRFSKAYTPPKTKNYEEMARFCYQNVAKGRHFLNDDKLSICIDAYFSIPKSVNKTKRKEMLANILRPTKKPDWDNIGKAVCDSLNELAYHDDKQIVEARVRKFYAAEARVEVTIRKIASESADCDSC